MTYKCMIIGLGQIGMGYDLGFDSTKEIYTHARAFSLHPEFSLECAVDPDKYRRDLFERHYHATTFDNIDDALEEFTPDVVVIASPTSQHCSSIKALLANSKPKIILCEKPLAYDLQEAQEIVRLCESSEVKLYVNYMRRVDPGALEIKHRIDEGRIAAPIKGVSWYSKGLLNNGSHFFNLLEFWLGQFVEAKILHAGRLWENKDPEPDMLVEFERGTVVFIAAWEESFSHYTIELVSSTGRLRYEKGGKLITWESAETDPNIAGYKILQLTPEVIFNDVSRYQWHVVNHLADVLIGKPNNLSSGRESLATLEAIHKIISQV